MNIAQLTQQIAPLTVEFSGEKLNLKVKLNAITGKFVDDLKDDKEFLLKALLASIDSWDATFDGKTPIPVTEEGIKELPVNFRQFLWSEIVEKRDALKKKNDNQSPNTSSQAGD